MNIESYFGNNQTYSSIITEEKAQEKTYVLHFDGCSKGNPGTAGAGAVLYEDGQEIYAKSVFVGEHETNNVAEYTGLIIGMQQAAERGIRKLVVRGDSQLVIRQMLGEYIPENIIKEHQRCSVYNVTGNLVEHFKCSIRNVQRCKVKSPGLLALYQQAKKIERQFESVTYQHIYREQNTRADTLSNEGLLAR